MRVREAGGGCDPHAEIYYCELRIVLFKEMVEVLLFQPQLARRQCRNQDFLLKIINALMYGCLA
jgi:hypothetical protein